MSFFVLCICSAGATNCCVIWKIVFGSQCNSYSYLIWFMLCSSYHKPYCYFSIFVTDNIEIFVVPFNFSLVWKHTGLIILQIYLAHNCVCDTIIICCHLLEMNGSHLAPFRIAGSSKLICRSRELAISLILL